jgi:alanine-glyoxylate transaminase / serine-glyoxylate transaminase / serine-pyruvate transaminase
MALVEAGADLEFGSGVAAAQSWYAQGRMSAARMQLAAE